jgi:hypothetical protein
MQCDIGFRMALAAVHLVLLLEVGQYVIRITHGGPRFCRTIKRSDYPLSGVGTGGAAERQDACVVLDDVFTAQNVSASAVLGEPCYQLASHPYAVGRQEVDCDRGALRPVLAKKSSTVPLIFRAIAWARAQAQNAFTATPVVRAVVG